MRDVDALMDSLDALDALDALEQAIIEICNVEMAQAIHARKKVIQKR